MSSELPNKLPNIPHTNAINKLRKEEERLRKKGKNYVVYRNMADQLTRLRELLDKKIKTENYVIEQYQWKHIILLLKKAQEL